jgi:CRP-like cAMP-binding protein
MVNNKLNFRERKKQELLDRMKQEQENEAILMDTVTKKVYDNLLEKHNCFKEGESDEETEEGDILDEKINNEKNYVHEYAKPRKYILKHNSRFKFWFDMIIISLASFNVFSIPFVIAFEPSEADSPAYITIVMLINFIFVIDIFVNLRTTYINNRTGDEVWDPKMIAKKYVLGVRFWIDLLSALPFDQFLPKGTGRDLFSLLGMLKAVRVLRLSKVIQSLNIRQDIKAYLKLLKLVFYLTIYIHFIACIFYYVVDLEKKWLPGLDFMFGQSNFFNETIMNRYLNMMYHAVMLIGLNEVYAHTTYELFTISFLMLISSMVNANIFGIIAVLVSEANKGMTQFQEQMDTSNTAMSNLRVPVELQRKVKEYMLVTKNNQQHQEELKEFLKHISPSLKQKVYIHIFSEASKLNDILFDIFETDPEGEKILDFFVSKLSTELWDPETVIIEQGAALSPNPKENYFYLITKGEWAVISKDKATIEDTQIKVMLPGDHFGEVGLLYKCKRTATVMSNNYCTLGKITEYHFKDFLSRFSKAGIEEQFREAIYQYKDPVTIFLLEAIDKISYFRNASEKTKRDIVYSLNPVNFDKGGLIFKPGDEADAMYIVDSGVVEIYIVMDKGMEFVIDRLYKGSVINHRAFLFNDVIDTYARCASLVSMFYIKIDDLSNIREKDHLVDSQINRIEESMVYRDNVVAIDYIIWEPENKKRKKRTAALHARRNELTHVFKNAVMYHIGKNREKRKKPNLSDILFAAVEKKKREMQAARKKRANFDNEDNKGNYLTDDEYELVCEIIDKIYKVKDEQAVALETLQKKFEILLKLKPNEDFEPIKKTDTKNNSQKVASKMKKKMTLFDEESEFGEDEETSNKFL